MLQWQAVIPELFATKTSALCQATLSTNEKENCYQIIHQFYKYYVPLWLMWLVGALTILGFADSRASTALQILFVILNALQGFFVFLFFCVLSKDT